MSIPSGYRLFNGKITLGIILILGLSQCRMLHYEDPGKSMERAARMKPYDAIIIPGLPADSLSIHPILKDRIRWAVFLYRNGYAKNLIFSGSAVYSPFIEGKAMAQYALSCGVHPENIFVETKAEHTSENMYYSFVLAREQGFSKLAFASQAQQTNPIKGLGDKLGIDMLPILPDSIQGITVPWQTADLSACRLPGFVPLPDREGLLKRLRGTMGYRVRKEMRKEKDKK